MSDTSGSLLQPHHLPRPHHRLCIDAQIGQLHLQAQLHLSSSWTVIFGPSGSGKSSILKAACGLLHSGDVEFSECSGPNAAWLEIQSRSHSTPPPLRSIGYAPQGDVLFPHLTVRENIAFASTARNRRAENSQLITEMIDLFELTSLASRLPRDLSGGERQRVNLARAFAVPGPRLVLLDEPFTGIDRSMRDTLLPRMRKRIEQLSVAVLSVTHDVEEALLLNAEVIRLASGRVLAQGPAAEVLSSERGQMLNLLRS